MNHSFSLGRSLRSALLALTLCLFGTAYAQRSGELQPLFSFHTNIYEDYGASNQFSIVLGVTDSIYLSIDCGNGPSEYEIGPAVMEDGSISGTLIYCSVNAAGNVTVSGRAEDAAKIDYLNADGCYISDIDLSKLVNLDVLTLRHNELQDIDLSHNTKIRALYLSDNTFTRETPLVIGEKPDLTILEMQIVDYLDPNFDLTKYPKMASFDAYHCPTLTKIDPTNCPDLLQLTLEMTNVASVDVTKNPNLVILNISETAVTEIDLSQNTKLQQLYCEHVSGTYNTGVRLDALDVTNSPDLIRLICAGNNIKELDLTHNPLLITLTAQDNYLTSIDLSQCTQLSWVKLDRNCLDFATLPLDPGTWEEYTYEQRPLPTERSYAEGTVLDFSARVLREGTYTEAKLYSFAPTTPDTWVALDDSYYTYADGKITLHKACADSVFVVFANDAFLASNLETERFMVKTEADYGKPSLVLSFTPSVTGFSFLLGAVGATPEAPKTVYIDYGNGQVPVELTASTLADATPIVAQNTMAYMPIRVYVDDNTSLSALSLESVGLSSINVSQLYDLTELDLSGSGLYSLDLQNNRRLRTLDLSHNNLPATFSLAGANDLFAKNVLRDINLSYNRISELTLSPLLAIHYLDLSHNQIAKLDISDADSLKTLDLSYNKLETINLQYCGNLREADLSNNSLSEINLPTENGITSLALDHNLFTLANLPQHGNLAEADYSYAPQADIVIATKGPVTDLSAQNVTIAGETTQFRWIKEDGTALVEGTDYTITDGLTRFINTEAGKVYCEITHTAFPAFTGENVLKTTPIEVAGMPTNRIASFVTVNTGDSVGLSLAANTDGVALYIDWEGNGNMTQYVLGTTYTLFSAQTLAGKTVGVYTYTPEERITVFSMTGATLSSFDGSLLNDASTITIQNSGLSQITLPTNKQTLLELNLTGNKFTSVDFASYPNLVYLSIGDNQLTTLDLSQNKNLLVAGAGSNQLTEVIFDNPSLYYVDLSDNLIESIDLTKVPAMQQLGLSFNRLHTIDVEPLTQLLALYINNNYFDFTTLPQPKERYVRYVYANQAMIEATLQEQNTIDLSHLAAVGDSITTYTWYLGVPSWDSDQGAYVGEDLIEGTEYTIENGVTTFINTFRGVICLLHNPLFPDLYLYTDLFDVVGTALEQVEEDGLSLAVRARDIILTTDADRAVALYTTAGQLITTTTSALGETVLTTPAAGAYIVRVDDRAYKVLVP